MERDVIIAGAQEQLLCGGIRMAKNASKSKYKCLFCSKVGVTKSVSGGKTTYECETCGKVDAFHVKEVSK